MKESLQPEVSSHRSLWLTSNTALTTLTHNCLVTDTVLTCAVKQPGRLPQDLTQANLKNMNGKGIMAFTCLILDRWLFVKRSNTGFKEEAIIEKVEDK